MISDEHTDIYQVFDIMRNRFFITFSAVFIAALSGIALPLTNSSVGNPSIRSPIGPATVPQSSYRSGLFASPNPIDTTGNLVITGNVASGKHFQGIVPYNSTSNFEGTAGSTTLDSFLRRSAGSGGIGNLPGIYNPYYSSSGTVTTTRPGLSSIVRPPTTNTEGRTAEGFSATEAGQEQALAGTYIGIPDVSYRPMRFSPQQLEKLILDGVLSQAEVKRIVDEQNVGQMERLQQDLQLLESRGPLFKQSLIVRDDPLRPFSGLEQTKDMLRPFELPRFKEQVSEDIKLQTTQDKESATAKDEQAYLQTIKQIDAFKKATQETTGGDVYEQMKQQVESIKKSFETTADEETVEQAGTAADVIKSSKAKRDSFEKLLSQKQTPLTDEEIDELEAELVRQAMSRNKQVELSGVDLATRAKSIMGEHKTFASYSKDKFNQHMRAAEQYLKEGKYYRAADTYTLASIYKPNDPLAYAGKSHALFAAGEYMTSALFLSRALEIFPEYAQFKIDIVAMVGDRDKLESRIIDIKQWIERSDSAKLRFLLGYIYYQMGRLQEAKESIDAAYEKLPDAPAVNTLKKAIDIAATDNQAHK
jgi:tetratricopeptide (TPR) repeat protein